ncbi:response regulator [Costertonia aggregata]|uniref:Response regulator n=1 Tax=Costertonia aggregata TaxID=343403 RepID=A0A7H9ATM4_9FLAO|nr:hypothetical protein [Costertonia aggregata]QLG46545.1 hypothetical protein HYG79_14710 [Costertonia aggregata]
MNGNIKKKILVDDDEDNRFLFAEAFEDLKVGAELLLFEDGLTLLEYLKKNRLPFR